MTDKKDQAALKRMKAHRLAVQAAAPKKAAAKKTAPKKDAAPAKPAVLAVPGLEGSPKKGTATGTVWIMAEKNSKLKNPKSRKVMIELMVEEGVSKGTAGVQYTKWQRAHDAAAA